MEKQLRSSPKLGFPTENDDVKYVSGLSTILVAAIQEAKDRISQIEYIFCSQLFPNFQAKSKLLSRIYVDARRAADDEWKGKENDLLLRLELLEREMQQTLEENQSLKLEKASNRKEQREDTSELLARIESQQLKVDELELNLQRKSKEVDEGLKLQNSLLQLIQTKASEIVDKGKQLKEHEERMSVLLAKLSGLDRKVNDLQDQLKKKTEEVAKGNELKGNLLKKIESQALEIMDNEQLLRDQEKEKQILTTKLICLEETVHYLRSCQNVNMNGSEVLKHLEESERENKLLSAKVNALEEKINELQVDLSDSTNDMSKGKDLYQKALEQIESKTVELLAERKKRKDHFDAYKRLKSQYNFLLKKLGLPEESMISPLKICDESDLLKHIQNQITSLDIENRDRDTSITACDATEAKSKKTKINNFNDEKREALVQASKSLSPTLPIAPKCTSTVKSATLAGSKRRASCWRDTRSHQGQNGPDPHDDFLNTPLENVRGNLNKSTRGEACEHQVPVQKDKKVDSSDDETQDVNADQNPQKNQMPVPVTKGKCFKFVEPVRKKADRENLIGVECRQCKKFYDAVLCSDDDKDGNNDKHNIRCEHHEGVSRHRYRYVPPMTPEGFWNIGFESET